MLLNCNFRSAVLRRNTQITVILPTPEEEAAPIAQNMKVLYLLHGLHGDETSWVRFSNVERYAKDTGIAIVMPGVGNSFYQDMAHGERFYTYMTEELPKFIQGLFPVSRKREDTYIAGLSMGGYGAFFLGLSRPDLYAAAASFSGAVDIAFHATPLQMPQNSPHQVSGEAQLPFFVADCFGDFGKMKGSHRDVIALYEKADKETLPRLYQSCGTKDYLYGMNKCFYGKMTELGAQIEWRETEGMAHEWDFWDMEIRYLLKTWLKDQ